MLTAQRPLIFLSSVIEMYSCKCVARVLITHISFYTMAKCDYFTGLWLGLFVWGLGLQVPNKLEL